MLRWVVALPLAMELAVLPLATVSHQAVAEGLIFEKKYFDLPSLSLSEALIEFAFQANAQVVAHNTNLTGFLSSGAKGSFGTKDALTQLLLKTPFCFDYRMNDNLYIIQLCKDEVNVEPTLAKKNVNPTPIEEVVITSAQYPFRYQSILNTSTRNGISLFDSSRFHSVVSQSLIQDLNSESLFDAIKYNAGMTYSDRYLNTNDDYFIRGFLQHNTYLNGLRLSDDSAYKITPESIEHVDIQKGPSMLFYGQSSAGGVVDVITQRSHENSLTTKFDFKDTGATRHYIEWNKVVPSLNQLSVKMAGAQERYNLSSTRDDQRSMLSIDSQLSIHSSAEIFLDYEWQGLNIDNLNNYPVLSANGQILAPRYNDFIGTLHPGYSANIDMIRSGFNIFDFKDWLIQGAIQIQNEDRIGVRMAPEISLISDILLDRPQSENQRDAVMIGGLFVAPIIRRELGLFTQNYWDIAFDLFDQAEHEKNLSLNYFAQTDVDVLNVSNRIVIGGDAYFQKMEERYLLRPHAISDVALAENANPYEDMMSLIKNGVLNQVWDQGNYIKEYLGKRSDYGGYIQMYSHWTQQFTSFMGWRYSIFSGERQRLQSMAPKLKIDANDLALQLGMVWQVLDTLSIFSNYSENAAFHYILDDQNQYSNDPEKSQQWELGLKGLLLDNKIILSASVFKIESNDIYDIQFISGRRNLRGPLTRQEVGFEAEMNYEMTSKLDLLMGLTLTEQHLNDQAGNALAVKGVADQTASLVARYALSKKWFATARVYYVSDRAIDDYELQKLDGYYSADFSLTKEFTAWEQNQKISIGVQNVGSPKYNLSAYQGVRVSPAVAETVKLSFLFSF